MPSKITTLCLLISLTYASALQAVNGRIKISTGTTSGCGDTVNFISTQLADTYEEYKDFLDIEFVPWGRTQRSDDGSLICQFGVNDCWANRLHRCVLDILKDNQDAQMQYMTCEFSSPFPSFLLGNYQCAQAVGLSLVDVDYCVSTTGGSLEAAAEEAAAAPMADINFVPSIVFNDQIDIELHIAARTRLKSMVCFALAEDPSTGVTDCEI